MLQAAASVFESLEIRRLLSAGAHGHHHSFEYPYGGGALAVRMDLLSHGHAQAPHKPQRPDLQPGSDNGISSTDNVTSVARPVFTIKKVDPGTTLQLLRDGVVVASQFTTHGGRVSIRDAGPISSGMHVYTARAVSLMGLIGAQSPRTRVMFQIIATQPPPPPPPVAPPAPLVPDLSAASDSGSRNDDNITSTNTGLSFFVGAFQTGMTVELLRGGVVVASGVADGSDMTFIDSSVLSDGTYQYSTRVSDAGSALSSTGPSLDVTVDTTAPAVPSAPVLSVSSDTGIKADGITTDRRPSLTIGGLEAGSSVQLYADGVLVGSGVATGSTLTVQSSVLMSAGSHSFTVTLADAAGNNAPAASDATSETFRNALAGSDYDGDGISDLAILTDGVWQIQLSSGGTQTGELDFDGVAIPGDYDGDGKTDLTIDCDNIGVVQTAPSSQPGTASMNFVGSSEDVPATGDFDGDGISDLVSYNSTSGVFTVEDSSGGERTVTFAGAAPNSVPVAADYDGDARTDLALYDPASGVWTIQQSSDGAIMSRTFAGAAGDMPLAADYDGDGFADLAFYTPATGQFNVLASSAGTLQASVGSPDSLPVAGDFDGDGKIDFAVFSQSAARWTILGSTAGLKTVAQGTAGGTDQPLSPSPQQVVDTVLND
jgi:hypothetical protein